MRPSYKIIASIVTLLMVGGWLVTRPYHIDEPPIAHTDTQGYPLTERKSFGRGSGERPPKDIVDLVTAVEDQRIDHHPGVDMLALAEAIKTKIQGTYRRGGASTIAQQTIKHHQNHRSRHRSNKLREMRYALRLTKTYPTQEIMRHYLNRTPFVYQVRGWRSACWFFWGVSCEQISTPQRRVLLMMAQRSLNPYRSADQDRIIDRIQMYQRVRHDLLDPTIVVDGRVFASLASTKNRDMRIEQLFPLTNHPGSQVYDRAMAESIDGLLDQTQDMRAEYGAHDCCVLVLDSDGQLKAASMCVSYDDAQRGSINACLIRRQTGSVTKPFLYVHAFRELGRSPQTIIADEPVEYTLADGSIYSPKNFDLTYHGEVSIAYALGNSLNIPVVKTLHQVGVDSYLAQLQKRQSDYAPRLTHSSQSAHELGLSMALGTYEMSPLMMTQLWRVFGDDDHPYTLQARQVRSILTDHQHKIASFGQDSFLDQSGRAVKTGTSRHFVDGWICGIHQGDDTVVCLWLGNYDNTPMQGVSSEVGSYLWSEVVKRVVR